MPAFLSKIQQLKLNHPQNKNQQILDKKEISNFSRQEFFSS